MGDEKAWAPVNLMMRKLSQRRMGQIWLHHTGHDKSRGFGTKTREWQMDTVAILTRPEDDEEVEDAIELKFTKARLRTPRNRDQFDPKLIKCEPDGWKVIGEPSPRRGAGRPRSTESVIARRALIDAYDRLADGVEPAPGPDGSVVRKVAVDALRDEVKNRGYLEIGDTGGLTANARKIWQRAKGEVLARGALVEKDGFIWSAKTERTAP